MNNDESEILWRMYEQHSKYARHHETQRANLTSIIVIVAAGLITFIGNKDAQYEKWPMCLFLILIGLFGILTTLKLSRRAGIHAKAAAVHRDALDILSGVYTSCLRTKTEKKFNEENKVLKWFEPIPAHYLWACLHLIIAGIGFILLYLELSKKGFF